MVRIVFLCFFTAHVLLGRALAVVNARHIAAQRGHVPPLLRDALTPENLSRSVDYALARTRFGHINAAFDAALELALLFSGLLAWLEALARALHLGPLTTDVLFLALLMLLNMAASLPLDLYATFRLEARFGFNKTTPRTYWSDKLKGLLLLGVLGGPFAYGVLALVAYAGPLWWLWATLFVMAAQFLMLLIFPVFIAPLFNTFTPLADGELKTALEALAQKCAFAAQGIFIVDGSRRSGHSNAYFTGLGKSRRIVLYDTLLAQLGVAEIVAVLAHEIGHYKKKHIPKMLLRSSVMTLAGFFVLSRLLEWPGLYRAFNGGENPGIAARMVVCGLVAGAFTFWIGPLMNRLSRRYEYEADAYAASVTGQPRTVGGALLKIYTENLSTANPHPAYSAWHYSHPTLLERLRALETTRN